MFPFKVLEEKYRSLPPNIREAISSTEVNEKLQEIVNKYRLQYDEGEELTKEIGYLMLGLKKSDDFLNNVQIATNLDKPTAEKIVEDVNNIIFKDIKESLRSSSRTFEEDNRDDWGEDEQEKIRTELLQEIESPSSVKNPVSTQPNTTLMEPPEQDLQIIKPITSSNNSTPSAESLSENQKQTSEKKYIIDPYREPLS